MLAFKFGQMCIADAALQQLIDCRYEKRMVYAGRAQRCSKLVLL